MLSLGGVDVDRPTANNIKIGEASELMANNPFYSLLGECYTIVVSSSQGVLMQLEVVSSSHTTRLCACGDARSKGRDRLRV